MGYPARSEVMSGSIPETLNVPPIIDEIMAEVVCFL